MNENTRSTIEKIDEPRLSKSDKQQRNQYLREFLPAILGYAVTLSLVLSLVDPESSSAKFWILLPLIPMLGVGLAIYRSIQRADEYGRLLQLEAMAVGFGAAIFSSLLMGFLGIAMVSTTWAGWLVFGISMTAWGLTLAFKGLGD